ncbi:MAG TPA: DUF2461 domain-containing protein [Puia sp.]|nr:DUF2461 domain-containing protein [Puia sp.]
MSIITKDTFRFLNEIKLNNNKPWFEKNRPRYERARTEYLGFITKLIDGVRKIETIPEKEPVKYIQRIYRDIRFSKDKTPYKSHFSSIIERGPEDRKCPLYIQIQPGRSMMGGGIWDPSAETLKKVRQEIDYNHAKLKKITNAKAFLNYFGKISGSRLTRPPKGYEADNPAIEVLKFKQLYVERNFDDELVMSHHLIPEILKSYKAALPFFIFFDTAMGE